jgi:hypothetical protein
MQRHKIFAADVIVFESFSLLSHVYSQHDAIAHKAMQQTVFKIKYVFPVFYPASRAALAWPRAGGAICCS